MGGGSGALRRIVSQVGSDDLVATLAERLPGSDLTTLLLEVMRRRAAGLSPPELLRRYDGDRFSAPSPLEGRRLHALVADLLAGLPDDVDVVELAPVAPLGTHSVVATVHQHKVVATVRGSEVAADPTNGLALEAAVRRRALLRADPRSQAVLRLAAVQRVLRGQRFDGAGVHQHFTLLGLVTAGRDRGGQRFEAQALVGDVGALVGAVMRAGAAHVQVRVTDLSAGRLQALAVLRESLAGSARVTVVDDPQRASGRGYYSGACFKLFAGDREQMSEVGDGGFVDWTQRLLSNRKERLLISGVGVEALAAQVR